MTNIIKLGLIDDDTLFLEALTALLQAEPYLEVSFGVLDGASLLEALDQHVPEVLLCDLRLKDESGLELMAVLRARYPALHVIALSSFYKPVYVAAALRNGFAAFLPKNCGRGELIEAVRRVHATGVYYRLEDLQHLRDFLTDPVSAPPGFDAPSPLSEREAEVVQLVCAQYTNAEIAEKLFISIRTVEGHRNRILEKTGIRNSAGLVVFAISTGLLDVSELKLRESIRRSQP